MFSTIPSRILLFAAAALSVAAQDTRYAPQNEQIPGPPDPSQFKSWLGDIQHWRSERLIRIGYDGSEYGRPEFKSAQSSFMQPQMMIEDRYFYDRVAGKYTVDRYQDDIEKRYGGIDSVLVWHTYAKWAGKRLPHEWERQYAAQGSDGRTYPWGGTSDPSAVPAPDTGRTMAAPLHVGAHPKGAKPFGVEALIGTVRQMTDEVADDHTSNLILKGGSHYQPEGSHWEAYPRDGGIESGIAKQDSGCTQPERSL